MLIIVSSAFSSIGENFEKGGVSVSGDILFNFNYTFVKDKVPVFNCITGLDLNINFFLMDNFAFGFFDNFSFYYTCYSDDYYTSITYDEFGSVIGWSKSGYMRKIYSLSNSIGLSMSYYFYRKRINNRVVPYLDFKLGLGIIPGIGQNIYNTFIEDKTLKLAPLVSQQLGILIFLKDRIALDISASVTFEFPIRVLDGYGELVNNHTPFEVFNIYGGGVIGIVFFIPTKDKVIN